MSLGKKPTIAQQQLIRELTHLRSVAGLDQRQIGAAIGLSQATVSRVERLEKLLSLPEVLAWADACGADADSTQRISALTNTAWTQAQSWRELLAGSPQLQDEVRVNESTARTLQVYSPTVVPGLLQTASYAERVLRLTNYTGLMDEAAALAGRWRRQEALADRSRRFDFVIPEAVLRWSPAPGPQVLTAQLDRLTSVAGQENVSLAVVPQGREPVLPFHSFTLYADRDDGPFVAVELVHRYLTTSDPADVALYQRVFDDLRGAAMTGTDSLALIQHLRTELGPL